MKRKPIAGIIAIVLLVIALGLTAAAGYLILSNYVVLNWQLFPKGQEVLDLRAQAITQEEYLTLVRKLPGTRILWSVPIQGGYYNSETTQLTILRMDTADVNMIPYFPNLQTVNAQDCTDYGPLMLLYLAYPELQVNYTVPIGGREYGPDTETVIPETLTQEDVALLDYLPRLKEVDGTGCKEFRLLRELEQNKPQLQVRYLTSIAGTAIDPAARTLEVSEAEYRELSVGLAAMPDLKELTLHNPRATGEELLRLRQEYPDVQIHWDCEISGSTYADDTTELELSNGQVGSIREAKEIASKFPNLEKLILDSPSIPDEDMAAYREEMRSAYKVVWTIHFKDACKARTDETVFFPQSQNATLHDEETRRLRYCEEMVCIDLGHHPIQSVEFAAFMPHLKYLVLAHTAVSDITPLQNCKELIYLELDFSLVGDYTPLLHCTALEDLNVNDPQGPTNIEPLKQMTWLKNLWVPIINGNVKEEFYAALPNTNVVIANLPTSFVSSTQRCPEGLGWRNRENYYDMRDLLNEASNGWLDSIYKRYMK